MVVGRVEKTNLASGYADDPIRPFAEAFVNTAQNICNEGVTDLYLNPARTLMPQMASRDALRDFFVNESYDPKELTPQQIDEHVSDMEQLFENDTAAIMEASIGTQVNPMIGMALPMHKFILMNMVFDKGAIPKFVAGQPKFTISMEYRYLVDTEGNELDMYRDQNLLTDAINKSVNATEFEAPTLPLTDDTEIVNTYLHGVAGVDHLAIETGVSAVKVTQYIDEGDLLPDADGYIKQGNEIATADTKGEKDVWVPVHGLNYQFAPTYGTFSRALMVPFEYKHKALVDGNVVVVTTSDTIIGELNNDRINLSVIKGKIKGIKIKTKLDSSTVTQPLCSVRWKSKDDYVEIGNAIPISTPITPQETKDIAALYNVNQVTKYMSLTKTVLANYKDDMIHKSLDESYQVMDPTSKQYDMFDFAPREGYALDHVTWRRETFLDTFDAHVGRLLQVLNDPNVTISVFGDPILISRIVPEEHTYQTPSSIGPVELDYTKTICTSSTKRVYQFIGSDKLRGTTELIVILCPKGSDRIIYRIYDYQMYMSNEIKDPVYQALPNLHAFERWKFVEYQPVQGRINILHPSGLTDHYDVFQTREVPAANA